MMTTWGEMTLGAWIWMGAWIVALLGMVWLVVRPPHDRRTEQDALEILRARFARGEISGEEFERARDLLFDPHDGGIR
jgi:putative membrane protein